MNLGDFIVMWEDKPLSVIRNVDVSDGGVKLCKAIALALERDSNCDEGTRVTNVMLDVESQYYINPRFSFEYEEDGATDGGYAWLYPISSIDLSSVNN